MRLRHALQELRNGAAMDAQCNPDVALTVQALDFAIAALTAAIGPCDETARLEDDQAVDLFSAAMRQKLAIARSKGRGGWQDRTDCSQERLSHLLHEHIAKGDPIDVANFCCFLWNRQESILPVRGQSARTGTVRCIGCDYDDTQAAIEGGRFRNWLLADYDKHKGVCDQCEHLLTMADTFLSGSELDESTGHCRVCGCTDSLGCPGGCYWVEEDLCSQCLVAGEAPR